MQRKTSRILVLTLVLAMAFASCGYSITKKMNIKIFTKEKTVLVDGKEVTGLVDCGYNITDNATIVEMDDPYLAYNGTLITGEIIAGEEKDFLDESLENGTKHNIEFYLVDKDDNNKVNQLNFEDCKITDKIKSGPDDKSVSYLFRSTRYYR